VRLRTVVRRVLADPGITIPVVIFGIVAAYLAPLALIVFVPTAAVVLVLGATLEHGERERDVLRRRQLESATYD
jgi:hypothetical protein